MHRPDVARTLWLARTPQPRPRAALASLALLAALFTGCSFGGDTDTSYITTCERDADCPAGQACSVDGYCFDAAADTVEPDVPVDAPDTAAPDLDDDGDTAAPDDTLDTVDPDAPDTEPADTTDTVDDVDDVDTTDATDADALDVDDMDTADVPMDCDGIVCTETQLCCALVDGTQVCIDPAADPLHCGTCDAACGAGEVCEAGTCMCPVSDSGSLEACDTGAGEVCCDKGCTNTQTSALNCGACGQACNPGEICVDGACACGAGAACAAGTVCCEGSCCGDSELCCDGLCKPDSDPTCECGAQGLCATDQVCCRDGAEPVCSGLLGDASNCGGCGLACAAGEICTDGTCGCDPDNFADCNVDPADGCEVSISDDAANCGACAVACLPDQTCTDGACVCANGEVLDTVNNCGFCGNACLSGQTCCGGTCVSLSSDEQNCSACGVSCPIDQSCCAGTCLDVSGDEANCGFCGNACGAGQACCGGICQDLINDLANCGACGNACGAGQTCCNGGCVDNASSNAHCGFCGNSCAADRTCCDGACRALATNTDHCGGCGNACTPPANASSVCDTGTCDFACLAGFADCTATAGCESDLSTDPQHCGGCTNACSADNGTPSCSGGLCEIACNPGWSDCNTDVLDGCEIETAADTANCGTCGNACSSTNGTPGCNAGQCEVACAIGFADCNGDVTDGCEVELATNSQHCNACNNPCTGGLVCVSGVCTSSNCPNPGDIECTGVCYDLDTSETHCGSCSNDCTAHANVASASCTSGSCGYICQPGFGDCTSAAGCETSTDTSTAHCGACGTTCAAINGSATCSGGVCGVACNPGFGDCDGSAANGCERSLNTDPLNCGGCNVACSSNNGTPSCSLGQCQISCDPGYANCDGDVSNGCEVWLAGDPTNCGACDNACSSNHGVAGCNNSQCSISCDGGWGNCDFDLSDGCETSLSTTQNCQACGNICSGPETCCGSGCARLDRDEDNCGACGNVCASVNATASCSQGICYLTCNTGYRECNNDGSDGCEHQGSTCPEVCGDGIDNDGDLSTDCSDIDCRDDVTCTPTCPEYTLGGSTGASVASASTTLEQDNFTLSCGGTNGRDASYSWSAPSAACWRFDTGGSSLDTVLGVLADCAGSALGCDNNTLGTASQVDLQMTAGQSVLLVVDSATATTGSYVLNIANVGQACTGEIECTDGMDNDSNGQTDCLDPNCATATACIDDCSAGDLGSATGTAVLTGSTVGESNDLTASCGSGAASPDLAYWWTAPSAGTFVIDTEGSNYDTALHIKTGCSGSELACNDDGGTGTLSSIAFAATAGQRVLIVVDGWSTSSSGSFQLNITPM